MSRLNNIDLLRLILSFSVVYYHFNFLTNSNIELGYFFDIINSDVAVKGFFVLSGLLIWKSMLRCESLVSFSISRIARLFPALVFVLISTSLVSIFFFDASYIEALKYLFYNFTLAGFIYPSIGTIAENTNINALNGSLWTLKVEFMFYIFIGLMFFVNKRKAYIFISLLTLLSFILKVMFEFYFPDVSKSITNQLPFVFSYFGLGIILSENYKKINSNLFFVLWLLFSLVYVNNPDVEIYKLFFVSFSVFAFSFYIPFVFDLRRLGDLSYGMYIYHFPIIQFAVVNGFLIESTYVGFFVFMIFLLCLSYLSWRLIEQPSLSMAKKIISGRVVAV